MKFLAAMTQGTPLRLFCAFISDADIPVPPPPIARFEAPSPFVLCNFLTNCKLKIEVLAFCLGFTYFGVLLVYTCGCNFHILKLGPPFAKILEPQLLLRKLPQPGRNSLCRINSPNLDLVNTQGLRESS